MPPDDPPQLKTEPEERQSPSVLRQTPEPQVVRRELRETTSAETAELSRAHSRTIPAVRHTGVENAEAVLPLSEPVLRKSTSDPRKFEDALLGYPGDNAQFADLVQDWARLCAAGFSATDALRQASVDARPSLRALCEAAAVRAASGIAVSDALASCSQELPPVLLPVLRAWERNGQRDADLRQIAVELRRLGELEQRNTFFQIKKFMDAAKRREQKAIASGDMRRAERTINASRGGIARRSRAAMRWTDLFVSLWRCGVPISEALEAAGEGSGNLHCRYLLYRAAEQTREGVPLSVCLAQTHLLPVGLIDRLRTGELSGGMDETLEQFARVLEGDSKELGQQSLFMRRILPAILLVSAVMIFLFGAVMGDAKIALIVALAFLPVAFAFWELVFKQSISGEPDLGIGKRRSRPSRKTHRPPNREIAPDRMDSRLACGGRFEDKSQESWHL